MVRLIVFFLSSVLSVPGVFAQIQQWQSVKSTHFIVYYKSAPPDFIGRITEESERHYEQIASDLGFRRYDFWLWENRALIYIHDNALAYQSATGQPSWSSGAAMPSDKIIHTYVDAPEFFSMTLPHEMAHIIFREFVGFNNSAVPLWLDEGVASFQGNLDSDAVNYAVQNAISEKKFVRLEDLSGYTPYSMADTEAVKLFYAEAAGTIQYLIKEFGKDRFVSFCQALRDKKDLNRALASSYPYGSVRELGDAWLKYLAK